MTFWRKGEKEREQEDEEDDAFIKVTDHPFTRNDILICATHGHIYAIHKSDGLNIWDTKFPTGVLGSVIAVFITDTDKLIVGANGKTACMNLFNGQTIWINKMPGFGYEEVSVLVTPSKFLSPNKQPEYVLEHIDAPPSYNDDDAFNRPVVLSCAGGQIMGMDKQTGETLWTYKCPGGRFRIPSALVEPPSAEEGRAKGLVYVGAGKWIYCLKVRTGEEVWTRKISDCRWGQNFMTLATPWSSRLAAEAYTAFSQNPVAQARDVERDREKRSNGGG